MFKNTIEKVINIPLKKLKVQLRNTETNEDYDEELTDLLEKSVDYCENYINQDIALTSTIITDYDIDCDEYRIYQSKFNEVIGISGTTTGYMVKKFQNYAAIVFDQVVKASELKIQYSSGYSLIPANLVNAILLKASYFYDIDRNNAISSSIKDSEACEKILNDYKRLI